MVLRGVTQLEWTKIGGSRAAGSVSPEKPAILSYEISPLIQNDSGEIFDPELWILAAKSWYTVERLR